jgi:hypothetical protein
MATEAIEPMLASVRDLDPDLQSLRVVTPPQGAAAAGLPARVGSSGSARAGACYESA